MLVWKLRIFATLSCYWLINIFLSMFVLFLVSRESIIFLLDRWGSHRKLDDCVNIIPRMNDWAWKSNLQICGLILCEKFCLLLLNQSYSVMGIIVWAVFLGKAEWHYSKFQNMAYSDDMNYHTRLQYIDDKSKAYWLTWNLAKWLWNLVGATVHVWMWAHMFESI